MKTTNPQNRKTVIILVAVIIGMFGFGFALVPLYRVFCQVTGLNGRIYPAAEVQAATTIDKSRLITVQFMATNNDQLAWDFYPMTKTVKIHPGQLVRVSFYAKNNSDKAMTVQAIPSVTPGLAAKHLQKTECFCFTQQTLGSGQSLEMPIVFHLDSDLAADINMITLSYTLFDTQQPLTKDAPRGRIS